MPQYQVVLNGALGTADMLNVLYYQSSGVEPPDWQQVADIIGGNISTHLLSVCGNHASWRGITVREDIPGSVGIDYNFTGGALVGSNSTSSMLNQLAVLVRKFTSGIVRPTRGWAFQGGPIAEGLNNASEWSSGTTDAVQDFWNTLKTITTTDPTTLTMVLKATNPTAPNTNPYNIVQTVQCALVPRTLDGRRIDIGS